MNTFHLILQRLVVSLFALCFMFVATYVPQPWNETQKAEAAVAQESTQWLNQIKLAAIYIVDKAIEYSSSLTATATTYLQAKESVLDGLAWALAKRIVSQMTVSIVNWINSGFKGSPNFVTDLRGFMLGVADIAFGDFMLELGGPFSFICSPFKLDIRLALAISYQQARNGYPACTLTGALANLKNFASGDFISGGWDAWFSVTSNPAQYTPYGSILTAQGAANIRLSQTQNRENKYLNYGNGFLSTKDCKKVSGAEQCTVITPGKVVQDALTFQLSTGPRSLIAADEINEILGALFAQLAQQAITGTKGLLGLSSSGYSGYSSTYSSGSYLGDTNAQIINDPNVSLNGFINIVNATLATENRYLEAAHTYEPLLSDFIINGATPEKQLGANAELKLMPDLITTIETNLTKLESILYRYQSNSASIESLSREYYQTIFHTDQEVTAAINDWEYLTTD